MKTICQAIGCLLTITTTANAAVLVAYTMNGNLQETFGTGAQNNILSARDNNFGFVTPNANAFVAGVPGLGGQALQLRSGGSNVGWVSTPDGPDPDLGGLPSTTDWTVELYLQPKALPGDNSFERLALHWTVGDAYHLSIHNEPGPTGPRIDIYTNYTVSGEQHVNGLADLALNTWYYAAAVKSGNTVSLYLDGALQGSYIVSGSMMNDNTDLFFGSYDGQFPFIGYVDDIRIWNQAVSPAYLSSRAALLVPEPGTFAMLVCGGLAMWPSCRRMRIRNETSRRI